MDTLFWTRLNPTVKIKSSKKQFYNKFLYKVVMKVPGSYIVRDILNDDIVGRAREDGIDSRVARYNKNIKARRFYGHRANKSEADEFQIEHYVDLITDNQDSLHLRYEDPWLCFYSNDLGVLKTVASGDKKNLESVHGPLNQESLEALERGEVIVKRIVGYNYKVFLKEQVEIEVDTKQSIIKCLDSLGDNVKLPQHCRKSFDNPYRWSQASYFYAMDDSVLTLLNLIRPGIVQGIFKLSVQPDK